MKEFVAAAGLFAIVAVRLLCRIGAGTQTVVIDPDIIVE